MDYRVINHFLISRNTALDCKFLALRIYSVQGSDVAR